MDWLYKLLEEKYSCVELQKLSNSLNKKYKHSYFYDGWGVLEKDLLIDLDLDIVELKKKYSYKEIFNAVIMNYSRNETVVKYNLLKKFIDENHETCIFEYSVLNSRIDFARVNGNSYAYEIKTELDNLDRLSQQVKDYQKAFEYVYVVVHEKHLGKIRKHINRNTGIISYRITNSNLELSEIKVAKENKGILKYVQLETLTSNDLEYIIKNKLNCVVPRNRDQREKLVNRKVNKHDMNVLFKEVLKVKNQKKWKHIKTNFDMLQPFEVQSVFTSH